MSGIKGTHWGIRKPSSYVRRGPSHRDVLRCPLCGKLSRVGFFSQDHLFGVYRYTYAGRGKLSCEMVDKDYNFMDVLKRSFVNRFLSLLEGFAGCKYFSQHEVAKMLFERGGSFTTPVISRVYTPTVSPVFAPVIAYKVVVE